MSYYFLSDLHLCAKTPHLTAKLLKFLQNEAVNARGIFILGDLFEYWIGDDIDHDWFFPITQEFHKLHAIGIELYFMPGNRDFLVGKKFLEHNKLKLLHDPHKIRLNNIDILLSHGDMFCTLDKSFQRFRKISQSRIGKKLFLSLPVGIRQKIATLLRSRSSQKNLQYENNHRHCKSNHRHCERSEAIQSDHFITGLLRRFTPRNDQYNSHLRNTKSIMDVEQKTIDTCLKKHHTQSLIHGHTHKPNIHHTNSTTRYVLGSWEENSAIILHLNPKGLFNLFNYDTKS